jgi:hypothetical protein
MKTREDVESMLLQLEQPFEEIEPGMWALPIGDDDVRLIVHHSAPLLLFRLKVMDLPEDEARCGPLFRRLLELNATDLVHGAYGIDEGDVILSHGLELETLDPHELQAAVDSVQMAVATHLEGLAAFR